MGMGYYHSAQLFLSYWRSFKRSGVLERLGILVSNFFYLSIILAIVTVVIQGIIYRSFRVVVKCFVGASFGWVISTTAALAGLLLLEDITWFIQNIFALETVTPSSTTDWDPDLTPGLALLALVQIAIAIAIVIGGLKQAPKLKTR